MSIVINQLEEEDMSLTCQVAAAGRTLGRGAGTMSGQEVTL